jgi:hypothetical protein
MDEAAWRVRAVLPVGINRVTRETMTLHEANAAPETIAQPAELTGPERVRLVGARWDAGGWADVMISGETIDIARAKAELAAGSELGTRLLQVSERAMEMALEDARGSGARTD